MSLACMISRSFLLTSHILWHLTCSVVFPNPGTQKVDSIDVANQASHRLIRTGEAIPFTAHATPPTITMPRVKAMTTGSIPSFLDVILNFAETDTTSSLATQDTWLAQIRAGRNRKNDGRLVMYGDDTWLKLFPDMFIRSDGTSSFFVSVSTT